MMAAVSTPQADPWICTFCNAPIPPAGGMIDVINLNPDLGPVGAYPIEATPDAWTKSVEDAKRRAAEGGGFRSLSDITLEEMVDGGKRGPYVGFRAYHHDCDPDVKGSAYHFPIREAPTLAAWCAWVLHLEGKSWMSRGDLMRMLAYWFVNRGINPHNGRRDTPEL
jgi:hypothetical protein